MIDVAPETHGARRRGMTYNLGRTFMTYTYDLQLRSVRQERVLGRLPIVVFLVVYLTASFCERPEL